MSTDPQSSTAPTPSPAKKARSPVERVLVWGGIIVLGLVAAIEFRARIGHSMSVSALDEVAKDESRDITLAEAQALIKFAPTVAGPTEVGADNVYTYRWFSLFKPSAYEVQLRASRGDKVPLFLGFSTPNPPAEEELVSEEENASSEEEGEAGGMAAMPPPAHGEAPSGAPGGRGPRPNPIREAIDKNGDFALSAEELQSAAAALAVLDADADGTISAAELASEASEDDGERPRGPNRFLEAIDADGDGSISAEELTGASAALLKLDTSGDGAISREDFRRPDGDADRRTRERPESERGTGSQSDAGAGTPSPSAEGSVPPSEGAGKTPE